MSGRELLINGVDIYMCMISLLWINIFFGFQLVVYFVSDFCFSHEVGGVSQILVICFE